MEGDDGSGLFHTLWRSYDNSSGRWTTPDPDTGSINVGDPQTLNRYSYVSNDPVNMVDPLGLMQMSDASQGWESVKEGFWGDDLNGNGSHFGGPGAIAEAETRHGKKIEEALALAITQHK